MLHEKNNLLVYASEYGLNELKSGEITYAVIEERKSFPINHLNWKYLIPNTRDEVCEKVFLLSVNSH